jgi:hypothetical protein
LEPSYLGNLIYPWGSVFILPIQNKVFEMEFQAIKRVQATDYSFVTKNDSNLSVQRLLEPEKR